MQEMPGRTLAGMLSCALLLVTTLLSSTAWSQDFDLKGEAMKKIVRDNAATQYAQVQMPSESKPAPEADAPFEYVPPEKDLVVTIPAAKPAAPKAAAARSESSGFASALLDVVVETLVDSLLDDEDSSHVSVWRPCGQYVMCAPDNVNHIPSNGL
jgi:hypothetical protein